MMQKKAETLLCQYRTTESIKFTTLQSIREDMTKLRNFKQGDIININGKDFGGENITDDAIVQQWDNIINRIHNVMIGRLFLDIPNQNLWSSIEPICETREFIVETLFNLKRNPTDVRPMHKLTEPRLWMIIRWICGFYQNQSQQQQQQEEEAILGDVNYSVENSLYWYNIMDRESVNKSPAYIFLRDNWLFKNFVPFLVLDESNRYFDDPMNHLKFVSSLSSTHPGQVKTEFLHNGKVIRHRHEIAQDGTLALTTEFKTFIKQLSSKISLEISDKKMNCNDHDSLSVTPTEKNHSLGSFQNSVLIRLFNIKRQMLENKEYF